MRKIALLAVAFGLLLAIPGAIQADQTALQSLSVPLQPTDWESSLVFQKFDNSLGTLTGVEFTLTGHLQGTAAFENTASAPATVTMQLQAELVLGNSPTTAITTATLLSSTSDNTGAFDGTIDFGGTSGKTYSGLTADKTSSVNLTDASNLALFAGTGSITLPISAMGTSAASGLGNLLTKFSTSASAVATLLYDYTPVPTHPNGQGGTPEPSSIALTACGGIALLIAARRRRSRSV